MDSINDTILLQWNCQGMRNKKDELLHYINEYKLDIIALQETMFFGDYQVRLPGYNIEKRDGHFNRSAHGGVCLYIHQDIPYHRIQLNTTIQAVAIRIQLSTVLTICNIYSSRQHQLTSEQLNDLYSQLPQPAILLGDFNAYNPLWGSAAIDSRGRAMETFMNNNNLNILNDGRPTRIGYQSETCIDLTICSPVLEPELQWNVMESPGPSDHCPIIVTVTGAENPEEPTTFRSTRRADWLTFQTSDAWENLPNIANMANYQIKDDLYERIEKACDQSIPTFYTSKFHPKPWWGPELEASRQRRENLYQRYRHHRSPTHLLAWKRARAQHKALIKKSKDQDWQNFTGALNVKTPRSKIYEIVRKIKGKNQRKVNILHQDGTTYSKIPDIAKNLAENFSHVSSSENYPPNFRMHKDQCETSEIDFNSTNNEYYNAPFTLRELQFQLTRVGNTAPGPDGIYYEMIKNMPLQVKIHLLDVFNKFYKETYFPPEWSHSIVIPIPKPGKDHCNPANYRPIALISCLYKILERILNFRLLEQLEFDNVLATIQCGCRRDRSTLDHLIRLENFIKTAFAQDQHVLSIFFDVEKAYDMTWRHGICQDMHTAGLRGLLPKYVREFLKRRTFQVRVQNHLSPIYLQENGVPQGSVLSVTLFALKINSIYTCIPNTSKWISSLYVDDLQIAIRHSDLNTATNQLQQCLARVEDWTNVNGFKFSASKTKGIHFNRHNNNTLNSPNLKLYNTQLPFLESARFLGLVWDQRLTWNIHINRLKIDSNKVLGLLRSVTCQSWGGDLKTTVKIYQTYLRSKLDYGCQVYSSAAAHKLREVDVVANEALRIATGAFKSTPIKSLYVLAGETPLEYRRDELIIRHYLKIKSLTGNPSFNYLIPNTDNLRNLYNAKHIIPPLNIRAHDL